MAAPGRGLPLRVGPRKLPLGHPANLLLSAYGPHVELTQSAIKSRSSLWRGWQQTESYGPDCGMPLTAHAPRSGKTAGGKHAQGGLVERQSPLVLLNVDDYVLRAMRLVIGATA